MNEREYLRLKHAIESEARKKLEALEIVYQMAREKPTVTLSRTKRTTPSSTGTIMGAIIDMLPSLTGNFDINKVIDIIESAYPQVKRPINPTSVSGALRKLETRGKVEIVETGRGKRPTVYCVSEKELSQEVKVTDDTFDERQIPF